MIKNKLPPSRCGKIHPQKNWIVCQLQENHYGVPCLGITGLPPNRRFIEFDAQGRSRVIAKPNEFELKITASEENND